MMFASSQDTGYIGWKYDYIIGKDVHCIWCVYRKYVYNYISHMYKKFHMQQYFNMFIAKNDMQCVNLSVQKYL